MNLRGNVVRVDLEQLKRNAKLLVNEMQPDTRVMAVVKADAYGHGLAEAALAFAGAGVMSLCVATPDEGVRLRDKGVRLPILVLGPSMPEAAEACVYNGLSQTVADIHAVNRIAYAAARLHKEAAVHIKVDTGMNRVGLRGAAAFHAVADAVRNAPGVILEGVYTHFADADNPDERFTLFQLERFLTLCAQLPRTVVRHAAASAAALRLPQTRLDGVRLGIALYGCPPVTAALPLDFAMRWTTEVVFHKTVPSGETIGYGRAYTAGRDMTVATLSVGYGDGYHRCAAGTGKVLIGGVFAPIVGRVCMDQIMVDVTGIDGALTGAEAVLLGTQGDRRITPEDLGKSFGTIAYEALLSPSQRVRREWIGG